MPLFHIEVLSEAECHTTYEVEADSQEAHLAPKE